MAKFFINRPDCGDGHLDRDGDRRRRRHGAAPDRAVPRTRAAGNPGPGDLCRRRFPNGRTVSCHADRAGNAGRRQHDLHELGQRQYRTHAAAGDFRRRNRSQYGSDPVADALFAGRVAGACRCARLWCSRSRSRPRPRWRYSLCTRPMELTTTLSYRTTPTSTSTIP